MVENQLGFLFSQIAESIRGGLGNIGTLKPNAFPAKIDDIVALIGSGGGGSGGGESGSLAIASGSFSPGTDGERVTVTHGLGVMPDLVIVQLSQFLSFNTYEEAAESQAFTAAWGMRSTLGSGQHSGLIETICGLSSTYGIDNMPDQQQGYGYIFCPDENTFQVGCDGKEIWQLYAADSYKWIAVSGIGGGVSEPVIEQLEVTENGTYTPPDGVDGYSPVTVAVPAPQIKLQEKTITENGEYTADDGFDGLSKVLVEVAGSGGGSLPAGVYWECDSMAMPNTYWQRWFELNGNLYAVTTTGVSGNGSNNVNVYKWSGSAWSLLQTTGNLGGYYRPYSMTYVEFNGKMHIAGYEANKHFVFDEPNGFVVKNALPVNIATGGLFKQNNQLKAYSYKDGNVYVWNEATDTWTIEATPGSQNSYYNFVGVGDDAYCYYFMAWYKYENGAITKLGRCDASGSDFLVVGTDVYNFYSSSSGGTLRKLDVATGQTIATAKTPPGTSFAHIAYLLGKYRLIFCDGTNKSNYIMHQVTE